MQFDVLRDPDRIAARRAELQEEWAERHGTRGALVSYMMPTLPLVCPRLHASIMGSAHRERYLGIHYFVQTKDRHIRQLIPAPEYYKFALNAIADERYSLNLTQSRLSEVMAAIQNQWALTREIRASTGQSSFWVADQVYRLKAEIASALFFARSLLDMFSTLSHFLYSPTSRLFSSFTDYAKHITRPTAENPSDPAMREYILKQMDWFWSLRDFRDFVTHHSSIRIEFYERDGLIETYLQHVVRPEELIGSTVAGIQAFLDFADDHFTPQFVERAQT